MVMPASMRYRGECLVQTGHNRCVVSVFDYRVAPEETVKWQEEEVDWGSYLPWDEVRLWWCVFVFVCVFLFLFFLNPTDRRRLQKGVESRK